MLCTWGVQAAEWISHLAYNNVQQIAMTPDKVYGLSNGSLYCVDKITEQMTPVDRQAGLHCINITCIGYDDASQTLFIAYEAGRMDMVTPSGVRYVGELYDKDMTQEKTIYNFTFSGHLVYLSTHYGVQVFDRQERKFTDSYWLRGGGEMTTIKDVLLANDSIYAFADDSMYCAALQDNLVDYRVWAREKRSSRIAPDPDKGRYYQDASAQWYAGGEEGIVRVTAMERNVYKPQGPLVNTPYRLNAKDGVLWMVQGGRWSSQYKNPGIVMRYDGTQWTNIPSETIASKTGLPALDFMYTAVDPSDINHYYIVSFGTGLYEFDHDTLVRHEIAGGDNTLESAAPDAPATYTRLDFVTYDAENNLWLTNAGVHGQLQCLDADGVWHAVTLREGGSPLELYTPAGLIIDRLRPNRKWSGTVRYNTFLCMLDDGGTKWDESDDHTTVRSSWTDQYGRSFTPDKLYDMMQDETGRLWLATDQGVAYIAAETDFAQSDAIVRLEIADESGVNPFTEPASAFCTDRDGNLWVGMSTMGIYVLDPSATQIVARHTIDNSRMPSNTVMSLAYDGVGSVYVGTSGGLCQYNQDGSQDTRTRGDEEEEGEHPGTVMQWKLHPSYFNPQEVAASSSRVYACASGSLFYVDRSDDRIGYLSKADALNGSGVAHILYDEGSGQLVIAYDNGRIDLLDEEDHVRQMPDLYMKASSVAVGINCLSAGQKCVYAGTDFGVLTINPRKAEVSDTYYIGANAASVEVQHVVEAGDTIYAFTSDSLYKACVRDNLVDYNFWQGEKLPGDITQAAQWRGKLFGLLDGKVYSYSNRSWQEFCAMPVQWMHAHDGRLIVYSAESRALFNLTEAGQPEGLTSLYYLNDGLFTAGEYWLAESGFGLIRLGVEGDMPFHTEGPNSNFGYCIHAAHGNIYSCIGGRWATEYIRHAQCNIYDGQSWRRINYEHFTSAFGQMILDPVSIAVDPEDPGHFYIATYGTGVIECDGYQPVRQHTWHNSTLKAVVEDDPSLSPDYFTRTDGAMMDESGNLWVLNATEAGEAVHVMTPDHVWHQLAPREGGKKMVLVTPAGIWIDKRNSQYKWFMDQRYTPGLILLDDGGTPTKSSDDRCLRRSSFVDQNGKTITPDAFYCFAQDRTNRIWIGTKNGIINISPKTDFFKSNSCQRIIIPRNDGTGLGDYLLGDEQINCMAVDGGNRMWIGTATSGLYVIEDDTVTAAHFTEDNSLLPSNNILSIAIIPETGTVFVGTDKGIASYLSDSSEPSEHMSGAYAFPNPVRPDYGGMISICGLKENTVVNIVDAGGNLVCKTRSNGGTAVWDGKLADGRRATPGVYTALCNAKKGHTVVKILVMR